MRNIQMFMMSLAFLVSPMLASGQTVVSYNDESKCILFAIGRLEEALRRSGTMKVKVIQGGKGDIVIHVDPELRGLNREGYQIMKAGKQLLVKAIDAAGAMYGTLDIAEQILMVGAWPKVSPKKSSPHFTVRAVKFNLPWSPYRTGAAMEQHMEICRDLTFWQSFLDRMADNRFNVLSLWNVHPFSFMVKPRHFPEANDFSATEMAEWKKFWTGLFRMCRERAIEPFIVNWNIAVSPEFATHYGVMERNDTSAIVKAYTREVVTQVIDEYPDLAGIGITLADWMSNFRQAGSPLPEMTPRDREDWIAETVVAGMKAAKRPVKFLHRSVLSADPAEMRRVIDEAGFADTTLVEIKFNWSHGHSTPSLLLTHDQHSGKVENHYWDPMPENYRIQWMIRNEDFFILRWGQADFIREHIARNSKPFVNGYFIGSEGYIPAMDFSHRDSGHRTWKYAFEKQWLFYTLWGRLLYDPETRDSVFGNAFARRYTGTDGSAMFKAYSSASRMPLRLASFHAATWDYTLYSEGFLAPFPSNGGLHDTVSSFISVDELIHHRTLDPSLVNVEEYVEAMIENRSMPRDRVSPLMLADSLDADSEEVMRFVEETAEASGALACERDDLETWAHLSRYFSDKLRAAVALHSYRLTGNNAEKKKALELLNRCLHHWTRVSEITESHYQMVPYIDHSGEGGAYQDAETFSWRKYLPQVQRDIDIANQAVVVR